MIEVEDDGMGILLSAWQRRCTSGIGLSQRKTSGCG